MNLPFDKFTADHSIIINAVKAIIDLATNRSDAKQFVDDKICLKR